MTIGLGVGTFLSVVNDDHALSCTGTEIRGFENFEATTTIKGRSETPQPIDTKFETGDYVYETTPRAKFRANPSIGGFSANG